VEIYVKKYGIYYKEIFYFSVFITNNEPSGFIIVLVFGGLFVYLEYIHCISWFVYWTYVVVVMIGFWIIGLGDDRDDAEPDGDVYWNMIGDGAERGCWFGWVGWFGWFGWSDEGTEFCGSFELFSVWYEFIYGCTTLPSLMMDLIFS
jgi:hypothetical protein